MDAARGRTAGIWFVLVLIVGAVIATRATRAPAENPWSWEAWVAERETAHARVEVQCMLAELAELDAVVARARDQVERAGRRH